MHTINATDPRFQLRDAHASIPCLPTPRGSRLLVECPRPETETVTGLTIGATTAASLQMIPVQFLVCRAPTVEQVDDILDRVFSIGDVIQTSGHSFHDTMVFKDPENGERVFGYVKAEHVSGTLPLELSMFHEPACGDMAQTIQG